MATVQAAILRRRTEIEGSSAKPKGPNKMMMPASEIPQTLISVPTR